MHQYTQIRLSGKGLGDDRSPMYNSADMAEVRRIHPSNRDRLAGLINEGAVLDAMAGYYALHHPEDRVKLFGFYPNDEPPTAFLVLAQTGFDLFRPLALPFVGHGEAMDALLRFGLEPRRPVVLDIPVEQRDWAERSVSLRAPAVAEIYRVEADRFEPMINVLITEVSTSTGWPRFEIQSRAGGRASAGVNWLGPRHAEIYIDADEEAHKRRFDQSLLATISGRLMEARKIPLLRVGDKDTERAARAMEVGYRPTGVRMVSAQAALNPDSTAGELD